MEHYSEFSMDALPDATSDLHGFHQESDPSLTIIIIIRL